MANQNEPANNEPPKNEPPKDDPNVTKPTPQANEPEPGDGELKDKHNEPAINRGRYDREIKAKDDQIAELTKQLEEATGRAESGAKALKEIETLKAQLADKEVTTSLKLAGCVNEKAAKALLEDYEGDVAKLKEACPYLFGGNAARQKGSTGAKNGGAPDKDEDEMLDRAFGFKK